jgi:serine/threonine-protein kinase
MGVVHAAFDRQRNEEVAIKRLSLERFKNDHERERATMLFEREYHTLNQLEHPHVIHVFDYGTDAQGPFYTMEHLRGRSLRDCAPLSCFDAARALRDVASALAIVHARRLVHRDVTPRNIYLGADGAGKLIDFGAMIPFGIPRHLVGTPAYTAPETLQHQPIDGRADLFALGASLYFAVSGRHAFAAHDLAALEFAWRTPPVPLARIVPGFPDALDELIMSLLELSPESRPRTAADVYERLTAVADLPRVELPQVGRAYLTKPALVGRLDELGTVCELATRASKGRGSSVLLEGAAGLGRSRLLDAALLESRFRGMRIARAGASDAQSGPLGVLSRLLQSFAADGVNIADALSQCDLQSVLQTDRTALVSDARREHTVRDLTQVMLRLAERTPMTLGIDDLHDADEASLSVLAGIALQVNGCALLLLCTLDKDASQRQSNALTTMREASKRLRVEPLSGPDIRAMLAAMFGEVANLDLIAALLQPRCVGNPRRLMDGAQTLIAAKLAGYEGGTWVLSGDANALIAALDTQQEVSYQTSRLLPDALELLEVLSLDRAGALTLADYTSLTSHGDRARMHRALTELLAAEWLDITGDRSSFRRSDQRRQLARSIPGERSRQMHARLAERYSRLDIAPIYATHHFIHAGQWERAHVAMDEMSRFVEANGSSDAVRDPVTLETLEIFGSASNSPDTHPSARANYSAAFVTNAVHQGYPERAAPRIREAVEAIALYTGLSDYSMLSHLPESERLHQALTLADLRCKEPGVGGLDLLRMIRRQTQLALSAAVCANFMADPSILNALPNLSPFASLSPALAIAARIADGLAMLARGQSWRAWDTFAAARAELAALPAGALDSLTMIALKLPALGYLGAIKAEHGCADAPSHLDEYAQLNPHNAESLRARYYLAIGHPQLAAAARKNCELLSIQSNSMPETRKTELAAYLAIYALSDDLLRLRQIHDAIQDVAKTRPGWTFRASLARAHMLRCRGKHDEGLGLIREPLRLLARDHSDFVGGAAAHVELLNGARHFDEAVRTGEQYLTEAKEHAAPLFRIELALARAHGELGHAERADVHWVSALNALETRGAAGILIGRAHEVGARLAICRRDSIRFAERSKACATYYAVHQNPPLAAVYARLLRDAARKGIGAHSAEFGTDMGERIRSAIRELAGVTSDSDFYARALQLIVEYSGAEGGYLFARSPLGLRRVATAGRVDSSGVVDPDLEAERYYARALQLEDTLTESGDRGSEQAALINTAAASGSAIGLVPCPLRRRTKHGESIDGLALLAMNSSSSTMLPSQNLDQLATLMTFRGDHPDSSEDEADSGSISEL